MEFNVQNLTETRQKLAEMRDDALIRNLFKATIQLSQVIAMLATTIQELQYEECQEETEQKLSRRRLAPPGECVVCDGMRASGETFAPLHDAHPRCESGKHSHCTCDTCF